MNTPAKLRILVVDNEPASTRLVRLTLEKHAGFEVCEVNDSRRAVAAAQRFQPGLILLDVEMPHLDGGQVARALHEQKALAKVPVVFMTSLVTEREAGQDIFCNGTRVLAKPITVPKLVRCVAEFLTTLVHNDGHMQPLGGLSASAA